MNTIKEQLSKKEELSTKEIRHLIGAEILLEMDENEDLPLPNKYRVARVMQEYYEDGDYAEENKRWRGSERYWLNNLHNISSVLRKAKESRFFQYWRKKGEIRGQWKFLSKKEEQQRLIRSNNDISTRTENHTDEVKDANGKWKNMDIPPLKNVPRIEDKHKSRAA